jgi:hypothetical protein
MLKVAFGEQIMGGTQVFKWQVKEWCDQSWKHWTLWMFLNKYERLTSGYSEETCPQKQKNHYLQSYWHGGNIIWVSSDHSERQCEQRPDSPKIHVPSAEWEAERGSYPHRTRTIKRSLKETQNSMDFFPFSKLKLMSKRRGFNNITTLRRQHWLEGVVVTEKFIAGTI